MTGPDPLARDLLAALDQHKPRHHLARELTDALRRPPTDPDDHDDEPGTEPPALNSTALEDALRAALATHTTQED